MRVIGTAGHVDHGKSTLVKAITGIDPDRLKEEKQRALTIDLGFAWLTLPSGESVGIVDVPGHQDFIHFFPFQAYSKSLFNLEFLNVMVILRL